MLTIHETETFADWLARLRDKQARARVQARINRLAHGNPGQHRVLDGGIVELKIDCGPGYRVYYTKVGTVVVLLLCGGDKSSQQDDIKAAKAMVKAL